MAFGSLSFFLEFYKMKLHFLTLALATASISSANLIQNGSFEQGNFSFGTNPSGDANSYQLLAGTTNLFNWSILDVPSGHDMHLARPGNQWTWTPTDGNNLVDLSGWSDSSPTAILSQDFGAVAGQMYTVTFDLGYGVPPAGPGGPVTMQVGLGGTTTTVQSSNIQSSGIHWDSETVTIIAPTNNAPLTFQGVQNAWFIGLDNVQVTSPVPEPASILAIGGGTLLLVRRRRAKK